MVEQLNNKEWMNHDDLAKLQQEILSSLEQHNEPDIRSELEEVKKTLENTQLSDQEKFDQIKDELASLKEKGVVFNYLHDLERKVDEMLAKESLKSEKIDSSSERKILEQISLLPNSPEKDAQIAAIANVWRAESADRVVDEIATMKKSKGVRWAIGAFFSSRI